MKRYWQRPEETAKVIDADGWLHTGDMARMDDRGYFYLIVDRKKDMILVSKGFNVYRTRSRGTWSRDAGRAGSRGHRRSRRQIRRGGEGVHRAGPGADRRRVKAFCGKT